MTPRSLTERENANVCMELVVSMFIHEYGTLLPVYRYTRRHILEGSNRQWYQDYVNLRETK
jgi:hypothetical protein